MLPTVNRSAVIVIPKQPFLDWLHGGDPTSVTITLEDVSQPTIYLVPDCEEEQKLITHLRSYSTKIFEAELEAWDREQSRWPVDRSFKAFCQWFEYRTHTLVFDLCDTGLRRF
jgi:hypothetical protein